MLIQIARPDQPLPAKLMEAPGGFAWWYLDAIDEHGTGLVLIWSWGLPFLPGYLQSVRDGAPQLAGERPSLTLSIYREGKREFYLLQEYDPDQASWSLEREQWQLGNTRLTSSLDGDRRRLQVDFDCPLPSSAEPLRGRISLDGAARRHQSTALGAVAATEGQLAHEWTPLAGPAQCDVALTLGDGGRFEWSGLAYHDRNGGQTPFDQIGIEHWLWGRVIEPERTWIYYALWPKDAAAEPEILGLIVGADGSTQLVEGLQARLDDSFTSPFRYRGWRTLELTRDGERWLRVTQRRIVDDSPFYLRVVVDAEGPDGPLGTGMGELVRPDQIDQPWMRSFVRMRVHHASGPNVWLTPFFTGPRKGRFGRLFKRRR